MYIFFLLSHQSPRPVAPRHDVTHVVTPTTTYVMWRAPRYVHVNVVSCKQCLLIITRTPLAKLYNSELFVPVVKTGGMKWIHSILRRACG